MTGAVSHDALLRVAREMGVSVHDTPHVIAGNAIREYHRMRSAVVELEHGMERANHRLLILEGSIP